MPQGQIVACGSRLFKAVTIIQQGTMTHFLPARRSARGGTGIPSCALFNRVLSHEIKNRIAAILGASSLLGEVDALPPEEKAKFVSIINRNARATWDTRSITCWCSHSVETDVRQHRHVQLPEAAKEAMRQVRDTRRRAPRSTFASPRGCPQSMSMPA